MGDEEAMKKKFEQKFKEQEEANGENPAETLSDMVAEHYEA